MARPLLLFSVLSAFSTALAIPLSVSSVQRSVLVLESRAFLKRQDFATLSPVQIRSFQSFSFFASAAYCQPDTTINWSCGTNCDANAEFQPTASGGDGIVDQFWYVGFDPALNSIVVAHQGTDPEKIVPLCTDADFFPTTLDETLFPGIDSSIKVHNGFADSHARVAPDVLNATLATLSSHPNASVTMVGHSLGAAQALLDAVFLPLHLPSDTKFKYVGYGLPRVGNQEFADYVDAHVLDLTHVNNKEDFVPIIPGRFLGFVHPQGEIHIQDSGDWVACPGQDNESDLCSTGDVPDILDGEISDHDGPYDVVTMGC
ncbi:hypothetical protein ACEPAI_4066 [Sanghuangporus weigelae]